MLQVMERHGGLMVEITSQVHTAVYLCMALHMSIKHN